MTPPKESYAEQAVQEDLLPILEKEVRQIESDARRQREEHHLQYFRRPYNYIQGL